MSDTSISDKMRSSVASDKGPVGSTLIIMILAVTTIFVYI